MSKTKTWRVIHVCFNHGHIHFISLSKHETPCTIINLYLALVSDLNKNRPIRYIGIWIYYGVWICSYLLRYLMWPTCRITCLSQNKSDTKLFRVYLLTVFTIKRPKGASDTITYYLFNYFIYCFVVFQFKTNVYQVIVWWEAVSINKTLSTN